MEILQRLAQLKKKSSPKVEPSVDLLYNTTDNEFRINGRLRAFNDKGMAEIGLSNIGDDTKFDLNAGKFVSPKWLVRGGIFESELGVGVDYNLRGPVSLLLLCMILIIVNIVFVVIYVS